MLTKYRGGLGHFAVLWAVALGADVTVISHSPNKKEDALKLGAQHFVSSKEKDWAKPLAFNFDFILNTADNLLDFNISDYFSVLKVNGTFHNVGMPDHPIEVMMQDFVSTGCYMGTSHLGNRPEMIEMLEFASKRNIKSWVETIKISETGLKEAIDRVHKNDRVHYRFTMVGYDEVFGKRT
jgi:alcohol dehydrogenase (NADP+)